MKLKIITNPKKSWAKEVAAELKALFASNTQNSRPGTPRHVVVRSGADATICIGGDGTILYACHRGKTEGMILGIGGEKSYICQLRFDNYKEQILGLLENTEHETLLTLSCIVNGKKYSALNDVVIHATRYRVAEMDVDAGGKVVSFEGDGMIISSSVGSAAYAYSAGGEKFRPIERKIILVPICAYKRAFKPKVLAETEKVSVKVGADCAFIIDGIFIRNLKQGEVVTVEKGSDIIFFKGVGNNE